MGRADTEHVAKVVEGYLLLDGVGKLAAHLGTGEGPLHLHIAQAFDDEQVKARGLAITQPRSDGVAVRSVTREASRSRSAASSCPTRGRAITFS